MTDPTPAYGRFTELPCADAPADWYDYVCEAEDALSRCRPETEPKDRIALIERAAECLAQARRLA